MNNCKGGFVHATRTRRVPVHPSPICVWGAVKKAFLRNKKPPEAKVSACYLYLQGPSLRQTQRLLKDLELEVVAHSAIWYWFQQVGAQMSDTLVKRKRRRCLVVDETKIRTKDGWIYVFAAVDPENREVVSVLATRYRESVDALKFLKHCLRYCKGKPIIATDGGPWYRWPTRRLGLKHIVMCGGERNYIERWFETFKDRLRVFDCYFPTQRLETIQNFAVIFCFWYNRCRQHMSFGWPPAGGKGGFKTWLEVLS